MKKLLTIAFFVLAIGLPATMVVSEIAGIENPLAALGVTGGTTLAMAVMGNAYKRLTPQGKQVIVADALGNGGIKNNQGTTVEIYDYIQVTTSAAKQTLEFFNAVSTKIFPFTNIKENKLQVGESLAIEYMFFTQMIVDDTNGEIDSWGSMQALFPGTNLAQFSLMVDNNRVMKPVSLARANKLFNVNGKTAENHVFFPDTDLVLPTELQFIGQLVIPPITVTAGDGKKLYFGLHWTGSGAILNLKHNV